MEWCVISTVFVTTALGMGVNMAGVNTIWHYGAPLVLSYYYAREWQGWSKW